MDSERKITFGLRLEDVVALAFFAINFLLQLVFSQLRGENLSPADVLVIIPAVAVLLAKELVHYFVAGGGHGAEGDLRQFVRPYWEIVRDWMPFLVILLMYYSLWGSATHLLVTQDRDSNLMAIDQRLFGVQASVALQRFITPALTSWMEFSYVFHLFNIPIVACFIYACRPRARFREMMAGLLVVSFLGLLGYVLVPAIGPLYTLHSQYTVPLSTPLSVLNREMEFMDFARIRRDVFPSLHVAISFVVWLYAWRNSKRLFWILSPFILSLWVSTVYLRYHYLIDCVAGFLLAPLSYAVANWLFARFGEVRVALPLPAGWAERIRRLRPSAGRAG
ncbi:MAG TPA: phosphatase PAP2 family protein [Terriglobia bacterium]|nr:phosphatase PAP2 family protein [Terriglobia bacterium]